MRLRPALTILGVAALVVAEPLMSRPVREPWNEARMRAAIELRGVGLEQRAGLGPEVIVRDLGKGVTARVTLDASSKGNGTLKVANLLLRVWDVHDDGLIYVDGFLQVQFRDVSGDGVDDFVVWGLLRHTAEVEILETEPCLAVYVYDRETEGFLEATKWPAFIHA